MLFKPSPANKKGKHGLEPAQGGRYDFIQTACSGPARDDGIGENCAQKAADQSNRPRGAWLPPAASPQAVTLSLPRVPATRRRSAPLERVPSCFKASLSPGTFLPFFPCLNSYLEFNLAPQPRSDTCVTSAHRAAYTLPAQLPPQLNSVTVDLPIPPQEASSTDTSPGPSRAPCTLEAIDKCFFEQTINLVVRKMDQAKNLKVGRTFLKGRIF